LDPILSSLGTARNLSKILDDAVVGSKARELLGDAQQLLARIVRKNSSPPTRFSAFPRQQRRR